MRSAGGGSPAQATSSAAAAVTDTTLTGERMADNDDLQGTVVEPAQQ